jgi:hypothetical protein
VVLQRAGDDFRRRSGAAVDQHDDRLALGEVAGMAVRRWVSSALRPRVETISPRSRKASETVTASSSRPPGLLRGR